MPKLLPSMKEAGVKVHNKAEVTVWVKAQDPDEACALGIKKICSDLLKERDTSRYREIVQKIKAKASVTKVRRSSPSA